MAFDSKYSFELWSQNGGLLADFSARAKNRQFSESRNEAESIMWELDLNEFEKYCRSIGSSPQSILQTGVTEVRIRRYATYLVGGKINYKTTTVNPNEQKIAISASGFLNLFKDRYTPVYRYYTASQATAIAASLISESQNGGNVITNSDFETDISGWSTSGPAISRSTNQAYTGTNSLQVNFTAAGQFVSYGYATFDTGQTYQAGVWAFIPAGKSVSINITTNGGAGATSLTYSGTGAWQFITTTAQPPGAISGQLQIVSASSGSFTVNIDSAIMSATDVISSPTVDSNNVLDFGITIGALATVGVHDKTYKRTNIKDALINLTQLTTNQFDFRFTPDKVFNTYASIGSTRSDITFEYPRNIKAFDVTEDATQMGNQIIGIGTGNGSNTQLVIPGNDLVSEKTYKVRQQILNSSATDNSDNGLTDGINIELAKWANPVRLLSITVDGNTAPYVTDYGIGDRVNITINNFDSLSQISGSYRIEKRTIIIDQDDNEEVTLVVSA